MKQTTKLLFGAMAFFAFFSAKAATCIWVGGTSSDWQVSSNWLNSTPPNSSDNVIVAYGATNYPVLTSDITVQNITINGANFSTAGYDFRAVQNFILNDGTVNCGASDIRANNIDINGGDFLLRGDRLTLGNDLTIDGGSLIINGADFQVDDDLNLISGLLDFNFYDMNVDGTFTYEGGYIQEAGNWEIDNFEIDFNGSETFGNTIYIRNNMTFSSGILITNYTDLLIFDNNATVSGASVSSHVFGPIRKEVSTNTNSFTFPTGNETLYAPIGISSIVDEQSGDYFTAMYFSGQHAQANGSLGSGLDHISTSEYWMLDRGTTNGNNNPSTDADITLSYNENTRSGPVTQADALRVARWNGSQWVSHGRDAGSSSNSNVAGNVTSSTRATSFSPFTLGSSNSANPLPIELVIFNAKSLDNNNISVEWATSMEINNDFFTVEKSIDGENWFEIGTVKSQGNSKTVTNYNFIDDKTVQGIQYYRLKQTDFDLSSSYSQKVMVNLNKLPANIQVFPVPAKNILNINLNVENANDVQFTVFNAMGQKVLESAGSNHLTVLDITSLNPGIYVIEISIDGELTTTRFVKD